VKILFVSPFDFTNPGGVNEHILHLDAQFRRLGHETRILTPRALGEDESDDGHFIKLGTAVPIPANGSTARITLSPFVSGKVKELLQREQFDIIHLHEPLAPALPLLVLLHSQTVNVGTFHAARSYHLAYLYAKPFLGYFFNKLHGRIAVSPAALDFVSRYFPAHYELIPNGIDVTRFHPNVPPIATYDRPTILFVGRYNESRKGLKYLIEAMALVRREFPTCQLVVVGPGDPERYRRLIERVNVAEHVHFVGPVSADERPRYYTACDVFCAPATGRESFGIVLLEAMACGRPVVASDIRGYRFVVRHGVEGLLVERKNPEALALALVHLLADPALRHRLGQAGRARAEQFAWPVIAQQTLEYYERVRARVAPRLVRAAQRWTAGLPAFLRGPFDGEQS